MLSHKLYLLLIMPHCSPTKRYFSDKNQIWPLCWSPFMVCCSCLWFIWLAVRHVLKIKKRLCGCGILTLNSALSWCPWWCSHTSPCCTRLHGCYIDTLQGQWGWRERGGQSVRILFLKSQSLFSIYSTQQFEGSRGNRGSTE